MRRLLSLATPRGQCHSHHGHDLCRTGALGPDHRPSVLLADSIFPPPSPLTHPMQAGIPSPTRHLVNPGPRHSSSSCEIRRKRALPCALDAHKNQHCKGPPRRAGAAAGCRDRLGIPLHEIGRPCSRAHVRFRLDQSVRLHSQSLTTEFAWLGALVGEHGVPVQAGGFGGHPTEPRQGQAGAPSVLMP